MTYKELLESLSHLTKEQLNQDVTIYVAGVGEFYAVAGNLVESDAENDVLDVGHKYIVI